MSRYKIQKGAAQNSIDYIVYNNIRASRRLLSDYGYSDPDTPQELVAEIKGLIRKKGSRVIRKLLLLHPDRVAILKTESLDSKSKCHSCNGTTQNEPEDSYCDSCRYDSYTESAVKSINIPSLKGVSTSTLEGYYKELLGKSNANPEDKNLAQEVQKVWNALRLRTIEDPNKTPKPEVSPSRSGFMRKEELLLLGLTFMAGLLIGMCKNRMIQYEK